LFDCHEEAVRTWQLPSSIRQQCCACGKRSV